MIRKQLVVAVVLGGLVAGGLLAIFSTAGAYSLGTGGNAPAVTTATVSGYIHQAQQLMNSTSALPAAPSWVSRALAEISQWFQNVMAQGAQSTGMPALPTGVSGSFGNITSFVQNIFMQLDAWLYGIIHFHIAFILNFLFGLVLSVLNIARNIVDWLNSIFRSAGGR